MAFQEPGAVGELPQVRCRSAAQRVVRADHRDERFQGQHLVVKASWELVAEQPDEGEVGRIGQQGRDRAQAALVGHDHLDGRDPGIRVERLAAASAADLLAAAAEHLGRPCTRVERSGRDEREVAAAEGTGLLILARDGDRSRLGPRSLGPASRFVVDHAPLPPSRWTGPNPARRGHHPATATPPVTPPVAPRRMPGTGR